MWGKVKKYKAPILLEENKLILLTMEINNHYASNKTTLVIELTPREIWELTTLLDVSSYWYNTFRCFEQGAITEVWWMGAKLVRKEIL